MNLSNSTQLHLDFIKSEKPHVLMITNHGIHQWDVVPGLPDTGGQNVFVNQLSETMTGFSYKVTIINRGGYIHPITGERQRGLHYQDETLRILYLEDGKDEFVRKEDMHEQIPELVNSMKLFLENEGSEVDLIVSHYWDAARIGDLFNQSLAQQITHIWVPHSLGTLKRRNVSKDRWNDLRIKERIQVEKSLVPKLSGVAATSSTISKTLLEDYGYKGPDLFLPPCVDIDRYFPRFVSEVDSIWEFLSEHCQLNAEEIRKRKIITEISRTDTTKRKDVLIRAYAKTREQFPDSLLVISIDERQNELAKKLKELILECELETNTVVVGSIWDILPTLYAITDVYCTPSVMEGFGMSAQEAAATRVPVVASNLVPFVQEYLLGDDTRIVEYGDKESQSVIMGSGAIVVNADDISGFTFALEMLLADNNLREIMGNNAYHATIPYFTWKNRVKGFLESVGSNLE